MIVVCFHLLSSQREAKIRVAAPVAIKARELMIATYLVGEKVRREKALDFSGCNSRVAADKAVSVGGESLPPSVA